MSRESFRRYYDAQNGLGLGSLPLLTVPPQSDQSKISSTPDIPLGPDDGVMEHVQKLYHSNPILYGSLLVLIMLWASLKMKY
jgi:hypothetical protein